MAKKKKEDESVGELSDIDAILEGAYSGTDPIWNLEALPSGILGLDRALNGGVRYGAAATFLGPEHVGKSLIVKLLLAQNQKRGGISVLYDSESAFGPEFYAHLGGQPETLRVRTDFTVEAFFEELVELCDYAIAQEAAGTPVKIAVGWDSVANTLTRNLVKDGYDKRDFSKASAISDGCKMLGGKLKKARIALLLTNQMRTKIGASEWEVNFFETGGAALPHFSSQRVQFSFAGYSGSVVKDGDEEYGIGRKIKGLVTKNRCGPASRVCRFTVYTEAGHPNPEIEGVLTDVGISEEQSALEYFLEPYATFGRNRDKFVESSGGGGWYVWHDRVVEALGKPVDWVFKKFRKKSWGELLVQAPQLLDPTFMANVD